MTGANKAGASIRENPLPKLRIQILHVADCPLVVSVRRDVQECLDRYRVDALIEEVEGHYPSPTLLVGGRDVTEHSPGAGPACRLDLPSRAQISRAIKTAIGPPDDGAIDHFVMPGVGHHTRDTLRLADGGSP